MKSCTEQSWMVGAFKQAQFTLNTSIQLKFSGFSHSVWNQIIELEHDSCSPMHSCGIVRYKLRGNFTWLRVIFRKLRFLVVYLLVAIETRMWGVLNTLHKFLSKNLENVHED